MRLGSSPRAATPRPTRAPRGHSPEPYRSLSHGQSADAAPGPAACVCGGLVTMGTVPQLPWGGGRGEGLGRKVAFLCVPGPPAPGVPQGEPRLQQAGATLLGPGWGGPAKTG